MLYGCNEIRDFSGAELMKNWHETRKQRVDRRKDMGASSAAAARNANQVLNMMLENSTAKLKARLDKIKLKDD